VGIPSPASINNNTTTTLCNHLHAQTIILILRKTTTLVSGQGWAALAWWCGELGLDVDLLHTVFLLVELVVDLVEILDTNSVGNHLERVDLTALNLLKKLLPVEVDWSLTVTNEANTTLHERANVEVVGLGSLLADEQGEGL